MQDGGYLFGACGAGSSDEFNEPGPGLAQVFGIEPAIRAEVRPEEYRLRGGLGLLFWVSQQRSECWV